LLALHRWCGIAIAIIVSIHIAAALYHHFVRKDRVLMRMLTG
jgi:cytochrome b561